MTASIAAEPMTGEELTHALRVTIIGALLVTLANAAFLVLDLRSVGLGWAGAVRIAHIVLAASVAMILIAQRERTPKSAHVHVVFLILALPLLLSFWLDEEQMARSGVVWLPFIGPKLVSLAIAFLSPLSLSLTLLLISAFTITSVLEWYVVLADVPNLPSGYEPWATMITGALACAFAWSRYHERALLRDLARARAEAASFAALGRASIALRDAIGTPLQVIEIDLALMERKQSCDVVHMSRVRRALDKLRAVAETLARYESRTDWRPSLDAFDAGTLLRSFDAPKRRDTDSRPRAPISAR